MAVVTQAEILSIIEHTSEIREYILKPDKYRRFEAGMFLQLSLEKVDSSDYWPESRTFSLASYYNKEKVIRLIIKKVGRYTTRIFNDLEKGSEITIKYAYGDFILPVFDQKNDIVCLAGGTGITPYFSFIEALEEQNELERLKLLYSAKTYEDFIRLDYLKDKLNDDQLLLFTTQEENSETINRRISKEDAIGSTSNYQDAHYYICGTTEFNLDFKDKLGAENLKNIYLDQWE
jgi:ferredoxin-NADP reductase